MGEDTTIKEDRAERIASEGGDRPTGRPSKYTRVLADEVLERLSNGETLTNICRSEHIPHRGTILRWVLEDREGFRNEYVFARKVQVEGWADETIDLIDGVKDERQSHAIVTARKNAADARRWLIGKISPERYGDKTTVEHTGTLKVDVAVDRPPAIGREEWIQVHTVEPGRLEGDVNEKVANSRLIDTEKSE